MTRALTLSTLAMSSLALLASGWNAWQQHAQQSPRRVIEARGLVIRDVHGQQRMVLGAPLPADSAGRTQRPEGFTGLLLLGPDGAERGGYGTADVGGEAMFYYGNGRVGDPQALQYQGVIDETSRNCVVSNGQITVNMGVTGRVLLGPAGSQSTINAPIRFAVERDVTGRPR